MCHKRYVLGCLNFWDEACWFLSLRVFGQLSSPLLLFPQRFGRYSASNNTGILTTYTRLWLTESEQATPVVSIKEVFRSSVKVPEFDKHLKKAGGHIGLNVVEIIITIKTIVRYVFFFFNEEIHYLLRSITPEIIHKRHFSAWKLILCLILWRCW